MKMGPIDQKQSWKKHNELRKLKKKKLREKKLEKLSTKPVEEEVIDFSCVENMKTVSIAVSGSILNNAQSPELRTYLAGQIARAACIFKVDEVVIFNDMGDTPNESEIFDKERHKAWKSCLQLERILQYLECPQYLRKHLFSVHSDLQYAGLLNPLDTPHHLRANETDFPYREGVVTDKQTKHGKGSYANIGLRREAFIDNVLDPGVRVTVKLQIKDGVKKIKGVVVPPSMPKAELGVYWGYEVRLAKSLKHAIEESSYKGGYDLIIGTSDKGTPVDEVTLQDYKHCIIFFGGLQGLEVALETDETLRKDITELFHHYINTCPYQGSRTIRTEEAILISLTALGNKLGIST